MAAEEQDIECPPTPSKSITQDESPADASPPVTPSKRAPSPPRWRFVNEAKSIYGYNSQAAGKIVHGKSSEELGAKYKPPDISLYTPKEEMEEVGKLEITEEESVEEVLPEGEFPGLPALEEILNKEPKKYREWDTKYHVPPKQIKDYAWYDSDVNDLYKTWNDSGDGSGRDVGRLQFQINEQNKDNLTGKYVMPKKGDEADDDDWELALSSSWQLSEQNPESEMVDESLSSSNEIFIVEPKEAPQSKKWHEKNRCRYFMLLFLLLSAIILGVVLGTKEDATRETPAAAMVFVDASNSTDYPSMYPSLQPTASFAPSAECPVGMQQLSIDHFIGQSISISNDRHNSTWELIDTCSGEVISKCLPCSLGTLVLGNRNGRAMQMEVMGSVSKCLPLKKEFGFHVYATNDSDSCCGFDAASFSLSFGNELLSIPDGAFASANIDHTIYFGDGDTHCNSYAPSSSPSLWPTFNSIADPSSPPSKAPITSSPSKAPITSSPSNAPITSSPSKAPITSSPSAAPVTAPPSAAPVTSSPTSNPPTRSPLDFVGGCPETFVPISYYTIGTQIESGGIVYECTSFSCGSYGFEPGKEDSTLWQQSWVIIGTCEGTKTPSRSPTAAPVTAAPVPPLPSIPLPTAQPTPRPTEEEATACTRKSSDFNLCLALDNSGSVCNQGAGQCLFCEPALFCSSMFSFLATKECCQNYVDMIEFSKLMVLALDQFEGNQNFSVVQFATSAQLVADLKPASETLEILDIVQFTGGSTDHATAIRECQSSFANSDPNRQNFIMMITDGLPSTAYFNPDIVAQAEATAAKQTGTFIIPVFISESSAYDDSAATFMTSLSSDGQVFDVSGFESLDTLKDALVDQVSCS